MNFGTWDDLDVIDWQEVLGAPHSDPPLQFEMHHVFCSLHGQVFAKHWPQGYIKFFTEAWQQVVNLPDFAFRCGGNTERIMNVLLQRPMCCWLTRDELYDHYMGLDFTKLAKCERCRQTKCGSEYAYYNFWNKPKSHDHWCYDCILDYASRPKELLGMR